MGGPLGRIRTRQPASGTQLGLMSAPQLRAREGAPHLPGVFFTPSCETETPPIPEGAPHLLQPHPVSPQLGGCAPSVERPATRAGAGRYPLTPPSHPTFSFVGLRVWRS